MGQSSKIVHINYCDSFNGAKVNILIGRCLEALHKHSPSILYFTISSTGGGVDSCITLHNFLRSLPVEVVTHNIGLIGSMANVVFLAGGKRYANPHSSFLFHGNTMSIHDDNCDLRKIMELKEGLEDSQGKSSGIITSLTSLTRGELDQFYLHDKTMTAESAKEKGIIHGILEFKIGKDDPITHLVIE